ncbi:MAG: aspartate-semialdehyde dehydrogenase [Candidatus Hydrothermarchaeaceae archaeon]
MKVAVLGATGMVGQRFVERLVGHPFFEISALAASSRSAGKKYSEATRWCLGSSMPEKVSGMIVREMNPKRIDAEIVFSALPSSVAKEVEPKFAKAGFIVASNASAYRMAEDVPLLIPEVNPEHLGLIDIQKERRRWKGCIITNPNCTTVVAVLSLKPIFDKFGVEKISVTSMQAVSGAGYSGVPSMAITDNIIPFIKGEEEKMCTEPKKLLGTFDGSRVIPADIVISASCNRVPVTDGHTEVICVKTRKECGVEDVKNAMKNFKALPQALKLPSAPSNPIIVREEEDRPQPRLDRMRGRGMSITVGRLVEDAIFDFRYTVTGHNTIRGAAGASLLNAELIVKTMKI